MKARLTDQYLESLIPKRNAVNTVIWDSNKGAPAGFGVRVTANGAVSFVLDYRNAAGKTRRFTIGQWPEWKVFKARERARALRVEIDNGGDPVQEKKDERATMKEPVPGEKTVKELAEAYMARHVMIRNGPDQKKNARRMVDKVIVPRWGDRKLSDVKKGEVIDLHNALGARHRCAQCAAYYAAELAACPVCKSKKREPAGRYSANQLLTVIKAMFNMGVLWGWCATNPAEGIKRHQEDKRQKWLDEEQLAALERAITQYGQDSGELSGELIRLLLLSGARRGEWMRAKKEQFDLKHSIWTKPAHAVKERRQENVPLNDATMVVLRRVLASTPASEPYLFPGAVEGKPRATVRRPWVQILRLAGLAEEHAVPGKRGPPKRWKPTIRLHDLRHSYASWLADNGESLPKIGKLLGHQRPETTDRYSHIADRSLRDTTNRFGDAITKLVQ
jgi:integrase